MLLFKKTGIFLILKPPLRLLWHIYLFVNLPMHPILFNKNITEDLFYTRHCARLWYYTIREFKVPHVECEKMSDIVFKEKKSEALKLRHWKRRHGPKNVSDNLTPDLSLEGCRTVLG